MNRPSQSLLVPDRRRIAEQLWAPAGFGQGGRVLVNVRHDQGWQTALTAAVGSAAFDAPQLGVENPPAGLSEPTRQHLTDVSGPLMAFGGPELVSDQQMDSAAAARN